MRIKNTNNVIFPSRPYTYATRYYYDESGNRVRKLEYFNTQTNPPLISDWNNPGNGWQLYNNEFYVKGVDGKDLATYKGNILDEWFVWGNDIVGKIKNDKAYYFYKDHLGSVRAIVNENASIVAAYDYDAWGYPLEGRTYNSDSMKFKYTGKELDKESLYDYFGARYYDSRVGRWGQVEPLLDKYPQISPYVYSLNNPQTFIDDDGNDPRYKMYDDPGVNWGPPNVGIGTALATATRELVVHIFDNPSTLWGMYKTVDLLIGTLNESARLRYEFNNSPYWTDEINVTSFESRNNDIKNIVIGKMNPVIEHLKLLEGTTSKYAGPPHQRDKDKWKKDLERNWNQAKDKANKLGKSVEQILKEKGWDNEKILNVIQRIKNQGIEP